MQSAFHSPAAFSPGDLHAHHNLQRPLLLVEQITWLRGGYT